MNRYIRKQSVYGLIRCLEMKVFVRIRLPKQVVYMHVNKVELLFDILLIGLAGNRGFLIFFLLNNEICDTS